MAGEKPQIRALETASPEGSPRDETVNLTNNTSGRIKNPLADKSEKELLQDVAQFAARYDLVDITDLLKKGALVARDPANFEQLNLTSDERDSLRDEVVHKWRYV